LPAKKPLERLFYEVETIKNNWTVKQLERTFDTELYVRTGLSINKETVIAKFKNQTLPTGFCFEARQKRTTFDNIHYRIDLVFYHRILKSHILIDLKIGKFEHADAGQMNVYLNCFRGNEMSDGDNSPIGLILYGDKGETLARFFVFKYLVKLPDLSNERWTDKFHSVLLLYTIPHCPSSR
jgi:predicted nuclease of restriction endonuclease-like (RecB) superfamily